MLQPRHYERFFAKVDKDGPGGCWLWTGTLSPKGYASFQHDTRNQFVHRTAYETWVGPIPEGLEIDHLCSVRNCVNPAHLEAVTHAENMARASARKTHCVHGHEYTPENTCHPLGNPGHRVCRTCRNAEARARYQRRKKKGA